jgi:hypothetical protein
MKIGEEGTNSKELSQEFWAEKSGLILKDGKARELSGT